VTEEEQPCGEVIAFPTAEKSNQRAEKFSKREVKTPNRFSLSKDDDKDDKHSANCRLV